MDSGLVLGTGPIGRAVIDLALSRNREVRIVTDHPDTIEIFAETEIVIPGDPTDPATLRVVEGPIDGIYIADTDPARLIAIATVARTVFGNQPIVTIVDPDQHGDQIPRIESLVDMAIPANSVLATDLIDRFTTRSSELAFHLRRVLLDHDGSLCVLSHDNPDPDAIASGVALTRLAERFGVQAEMCYFGSINHQENRAFVNLLDLDLRSVSTADEVLTFDAIALVDHSMAGTNDQLPEDTPITIVIDHHPTRSSADAVHLDLRSHAGSTSTLLIDYFRRLDVTLDTNLATALLFGIRTDTDDFTRGVSAIDFEAATYVLPTVDTTVLERVESPTYSGDTLDIIANAIRNIRIHHGICTSCVGSIRDRDALGQAADRLIQLEDIRAVVVYGFSRGTIYLSARARAGDVDIGETVREAFDPIGSAGGHERMAGAQIPLGILADTDDADNEALIEIVREVIDERIFETLTDPIDLELRYEDHWTASDDEGFFENM